MRPILAVAFAVLTGCTSSIQQPPPAPAPRDAIPVASDTATVWRAVLATLADRAIPVKASDRASGSITSEEVTVSPSEARTVGSCPGGIVYPGRAQYIVLVSPNGAGSTVRVATRLTYYSIYGRLMGECASSGVLESRMEAAIRQRVGGG